MTRTLKIGLVTVFLFQLIIAAGFELAHDEAYYWLYSKHLDWGYFDHPPFVGIVIKLFSILPHSEFAVRVGFILLQFASLFILFGITGCSQNVFLLFFSFPLASVTGLLAIPDMPLLFMTAVYFWGLKRYLENDNLSHSGILGIIISALLYAKYHGILLIFFTILAIPRLLVRKSFYFVAFVSLIGFFPHVIWQYGHDFATIKYHFIERPSAAFNIKRVIEYLGLQIGLAGLFVGPISWFVLMKKKTQTPFDRSLKFCVIGVVIFFLLSSFNKKTEANWTIFLAIPFIILISQSDIWHKKLPRVMLYLSFGVVILSRLLFVTSPQEVGIKRLKEFHGWKDWARNIQINCDGFPILANTYQVASKLSFYLNTEISALNYQSRKNQFDFWRFDLNIPTERVCYITDKKAFDGIDIETPEGKKLRIVKNQTIQGLWELKSNKGNL